MSTKNIVENLIKSLIDGVNDITGKQDTNLTDSVNALIEGYGTGGSGSGSGESLYETSAQGIFPVVHRAISESTTNLNSQMFSTSATGILS